MTEEPEKQEDVEIVYLGKRIFKDGKAMPLVIGVELLNELSEKYESDEYALKREIERLSSSFAKLSVSAVGGVYKITAILSEDKRIQTAWLQTAKFARMANHSLEATWVALDTSARSEVSSARVEKKMAADNALDRAINVIRFAYKMLPANQRNAFKIVLLNSLDERN